QCVKTSHRDFAAAVYPSPEHGAKPLGWVGFEVYADASYSHEFGGFEGPSGAIGGNLPGGGRPVARGVLGTGLPLGIDVEETYGRALDSDLNFVSGTVQWAALDGSTVT